MIKLNRCYFFKRRQQHLEPFADGHVTVGGDFNYALKEIIELCCAYNLTDVWRFGKSYLEKQVFQNAMPFR